MSNNPTDREAAEQALKKVPCNVCGNYSLKLGEEYLTTDGRRSRQFRVACTECQNHGDWDAIVPLMEAGVVR